MTWTYREAAALAKGLRGTYSAEYLLSVLREVFPDGGTGAETPAVHELREALHKAVELGEKAVAEGRALMAKLLARIVELEAGKSADIAVPGTICPRCGHSFSTSHASVSPVLYSQLERTVAEAVAGAIDAQHPNASLDTVMRIAAQAANLVRDELRTEGVVRPADFVEGA